MYVQIPQAFQLQISGEFLECGRKMGVEISFFIFRKFASHKHIYDD